MVRRKPKSKAKPKAESKAPQKKESKKKKRTNAGIHVWSNSIPHASIET